MSWFNLITQKESEKKQNKILFLYHEKCKELETVYNNYELFKKQGYIPNENINMEGIKQHLLINKTNKEK